MAGPVGACPRKTHYSKLTESSVIAAQAGAQRSALNGICRVSVTSRNVVPVTVAVPLI
jgi:hypothetical protein